MPRLVSLLAESFNAHMRFGSCLAIGISCAGTGSREAMDVLEPMMEDVVDFVRQVRLRRGYSSQNAVGVETYALILFYDEISLDLRWTRKCMVAMRCFYTDFW